MGPRALPGANARGVVTQEVLEGHPWIGYALSPLAEVAGFEPTTSSSRTAVGTVIRYRPLSFLRGDPGSAAVSGLLMGNRCQAFADFLLTRCRRSLDGPAATLIHRSVRGLLLSRSPRRRVRADVLVMALGGVALGSSGGHLPARHGKFGRTANHVRTRSASGPADN